MKKVTQEVFEKEIMEWGKGDYEVVGEYKSTSVGVKVKHLSCGKTYTPSRDNFKKGKRCSYCFGKPKVDTEIFKERVNRLVGNEYTVIGDYTTAHAKVLIRHNTCGTTYPVSPNKFTSGDRRCPACRGTRLKTTQEYILEIEEIHGDSFTVLGEYTGANDYIEIRHNECGKVYSVYPNMLKRTIGCNDCVFKSKGEERIKDELDRLGVRYTRQKTFDGCRNIRKLPYDFYLELPGKEVLIEYDGIQHFEPLEHFGGIEDYEKRNTNDGIKDKFAKQENIRLVRIPYTNFDEIEKIMKELMEE